MGKMNILLISGHTSGYNRTKNKSRNEGDLNIELVKLIKPRLLKYANVYVYPMGRDAFKDVQNGVFRKYLPKDVKIDYAFEVHFNALNGKYNFDGKKKGSEIFVTTREKGIKVEQAIMRHMDDFFPLRDNDGVFDGVKRTNFLVIRTLKDMGISGTLLETCFYDDEDDMKVYYANREKIADGIVAGMVEGFGLKKIQGKPSTPAAPKPEKPSIYYKKYTGKSYGIDTVLKAIEVPEKYRGRWSKRKPIAEKNGIKNYKGSITQNLKLVKLAKEGKLKRV